MECVESPYVVGEQVVADDAPVFSPVGLDDVKVVQVLQGGPVPGPGRLQGWWVGLFVLVGGVGVVPVRCLVGVLVSFGLRGGGGLVS